MAVTQDLRIELLDTLRNKLEVYGIQQGHKVDMPVSLGSLEEMHYQKLHLRTPKGIAKIVDFTIEKNAEYTVYYARHRSSGVCTKLYGRNLTCVGDYEIIGCRTGYGGTVYIIDFEVECTEDCIPVIGINKTWVTSDMPVAEIIPYE